MNSFASWTPNKTSPNSQRTKTTSKNNSKTPSIKSIKWNSFSMNIKNLNKNKKGNSSTPNPLMESVSKPKPNLTHLSPVYPSPGKPKTKISTLPLPTLVTMFSFMNLSITNSNFTLNSAVKSPHLSSASSPVKPEIFSSAETLKTKFISSTKKTTILKMISPSSPSGATDKCTATKFSLWAHQWFKTSCAQWVKTVPLNYGPWKRINDQLCLKKDHLQNPWVSQSIQEAPWSESILKDKSSCFRFFQKSFMKSQA